MQDGLLRSARFWTWSRWPGICCLAVAAELYMTGQLGKELANDARSFPVVGAMTTPTTTTADATARAPGPAARLLHR